VKALKRGELLTAPPTIDSYYDHRHRHVVFFVGSRDL
jgi:hypothetical protein